MLFLSVEKYLVQNDGTKGLCQGGGPGSMQDYIERQLTELHYFAANNGFPNKFLGFVITVLVVVLLPYLHIGFFYMKIWVPDKPAIDRNVCTCSCFDTIFRGQYENPGTVSYKHVYFNATSSTLKIWLFTAFFILLFYESVRHLVGLVRSCAPLRKSMLFLYFINLYPHYYSWWSFFSYYNEEMYTFFTHHFMFTVTEILITAIVLNLCNRDNDFSSWKIATIVTISVVHVIVSGMDQFITHVVHGEGRSFQNVRDVGLMVPDILHVVVPLRAFWLHAQRHKLRIADLFYKEEVILMVICMSFGIILGRLI